MSEYRYDQMLKERISKIVADEEASLSVGSAEDFADYKLRVGKIAGLLLAVEISDDIKRKILGEQS